MEENTVTSKLYSPPPVKFFCAALSSSLKRVFILSNYSENAREKCFTVTWTLLTGYFTVRIGWSVTPNSDWWAKCLPWDCHHYHISGQAKSDWKMADSVQFILDRLSPTLTRLEELKLFSSVRFLMTTKNALSSFYFKLFFIFNEPNQLGWD